MLTIIALALFIAGGALIFLGWRADSAATRVAWAVAARHGEALAYARAEIAHYRREEARRALLAPCGLGWSGVHVTPRRGDPPAYWEERTLA